MTQKVTPEMRREMVRLYTEDRLTATAIGQQMGVSNAYVGKILKGEGVAVRIGGTAKYDPNAVKTCVACGNEFRRKVMRDGKIEKPSQFNRRTTCSKKCRHDVIGGKRAARPAERSARSFAAEARFHEMISAAGGTVLEPVWLGTMHPTRVRCAAGHVVTPRPNSVRSYEHFCRVCAASANEKLTTGMRREIVRLYVEGQLSTTAIGPMFGISQGHVSKVLKDEGVTARPSGRPPQFDPNATKICEVCGAEFRRGTTRTGREEKVTLFAKRRTCSRECKNVAIGKANFDRLDRMPWSVGRRTLLAKTCPVCDEFLPAWRYQRQDRGFYATNCARCNQREWMAQMDSQKREEIIRTNAAKAKRGNDGMRDQAWRYGRQWTGPEMELAARTDLPLKEIAAMIGRTPFAVGTMRWKIHNDPATAAVAGLPRQRNPRRPKRRDIQRPN